MLRQKAKSKKYVFGLKSYKLQLLLKSLSIFPVWNLSYISNFFLFLFIFGCWPFFNKIMSFKKYVFVFIFTNIPNKIILVVGLVKILWYLLYYIFFRKFHPKYSGPYFYNIFTYTYMIFFYIIYFGFNFLIGLFGFLLKKL